MKKQPQHIGRKEEPAEDKEIEGSALDRKGEAIEGKEVKNLVLDRKGKPAQNEDLKIHRLKEIASTHLLVATLIATVAFAAGFTMPGGYNQSGGLDEGMAVLRRKPAFKSFLIAVALAFCFSAASIFLHFFASVEKNCRSLAYLLSWAAVLTHLSILGIVVAFISGTNVVLAGSWLAGANLAIGCSFFLVLFIWWFR